MFLWQSCEYLSYTLVRIMKLGWDFLKHVQQKRSVLWVLNLKPAINVYFSWNVRLFLTLI